MLLNNIVIATNFCVLIRTVSEVGPAMAFADRATCVTIYVDFIEPKQTPQMQDTKLTGPVAKHLSTGQINSHQVRNHLCCDTIPIITHAEVLSTD